MVEARPVGRPRDPAATDSILLAAAGVLAELGPDGFTIREVVARSGASSATVYRRWRTKPALILATAKMLMGEAIPEPSHGSLEADIRAIVHTLVTLLTGGPVGAAIPQLVQAAQRDPAVQLAVSSWMAERRAVVERVLVTARARGELRPDLSVSHGASLLSGPIYYRFVVTGEPIDQAFEDLHVREFLAWATGAPGREDVSPRRPGAAPLP